MIHQMETVSNATLGISYLMESVFNKSLAVKVTSWMLLVTVSLLFAKIDSTSMPAIIVSLLILLVRRTTTKPAPV